MHARDVFPIFMKCGGAPKGGGGEGPDPQDPRPVSAPATAEPLACREPPYI